MTFMAIIRNNPDPAIPPPDPRVVALTVWKHATAADHYASGLSPAELVESIRTHVKSAIVGTTISVHYFADYDCVVLDSATDLWASITVTVLRSNMWRFAGRLTASQPPDPQNDHYRVTLLFPDLPAAPEAQEELDSLYLYSSIPLSERPTPPGPNDMVRLIWPRKEPSSP